MKTTSPTLTACLLSATLSFVGCARVPHDADAPALGEQSSAIINGTEEKAYPAVGALIEKGFLGLNPQHKCTSVLIAPRWVLTAAHCLKGDAELTFSVGPDAKSGTQFAIAETYVHPRYDDNPIGSTYDLALIELASAVPSNVATPMPYNTQRLEPFVGVDTLYVGYGSTSGTSSFLGVGRKRRTSMPIERVDRVTFSHGFDGTGVCFGDSGGPALLEMDGTLKVVGVVSASLGCQGGTCDPCTNGSKSTRVDRFADWIAQTMGEDFTSCEVETDRCVCPEACASDGVCDHAVCATKSCGDMLSCLFVDCADSPDGSCSTVCLQDGTVSAREALRPLVNCWGEHCRKVPGSANEQACVESNCGTEWQACEAQVNPDGTPEPTDAGVPSDGNERDSATDPTPPSDESDAGAVGEPPVTMPPPSSEPTGPSDGSPITSEEEPRSTRQSSGCSAALGTSDSTSAGFLAGLVAGLCLVRRRRARD